MCGPPRKNPGAGATAALARRIIKDHPDAMILALGDNAYNRGKSDEYRDHYTPTWGQPDLLGRTWSCPGNHDYRTAAASPYFKYFGELRAGTPWRSYYSLPLPEAGWHFVSLNSEIEQDAHSPQLRWLRQDLAERHFEPILAIWHRPRWGSGAHRDSKKPRWFLNEMYAARAELVLNGHAHHYERFAPQRPAAARSDSRSGGAATVHSGDRRAQARRPDQGHAEQRIRALRSLRRPEAHAPARLVPLGIHRRGRPRPR